MKNHIKIGGQILQTNKKFSHLSQKQQEKIYQWIKESYKSHHPDDDIILDEVMHKISEQNIWISDYEVKKYYISKKNRLKNLLTKQYD